MIRYLGQDLKSVKIMLNDNSKRRIDYLRISVTDRCNLRCIYCMPEEGIKLIRHEEILTYEELELISRAAVKAGLSKIRLTGGEPLIRKDLPNLISHIALLPGLKDLALTTNGVLLSEMAEPLYRAGLRRVNISLDAIDPNRYSKITRGGDVARVLEGIDAAIEIGFEPVKINVVAVQGITENELENFLKLSFEKPVHVRFIEKMNLSSPNGSEDFLSCGELEKKFFTLVPLENTEGPIGYGPARYLKPRGAKGTIGFICPYSHHYCDTCNRLRLTADGKLRTCLFAGEEANLKAIVRNGASENQIIEFFKSTLRKKPANLEEALKAKGVRIMRKIGG